MIFTPLTDETEREIRQQQLRDLEAQIQSLGCMMYDVHNIVEEQTETLSRAQDAIQATADTLYTSEQQLQQAQTYHTALQQGWIGGTIGMGVGALVGFVCPAAIGLTIPQLSVLGGMSGWVWGTVLGIKTI